MKSQIIPAILTSDKKELQDILNRLVGLVHWVSIDIADGIFVDSTTLSIDDLAQVDIPFNLELHLMVNSPQSYFSACKRVGAKRVVFHIETVSDVANAIAEAKSNGFEVGLALASETDISLIKPYVDDIDSLLLLSVKPGYQGQTFIPETIGKLAKLKINYPKLRIEVDGGINLQTISQVAEAGADILTIGSAIVKQSDFKEAIENLKAKI